MQRDAKIGSSTSHYITEVVTLIFRLIIPSEIGLRNLKIWKTSFRILIPSEFSVTLDGTTDTRLEP